MKKQKVVITNEPKEVNGLLEDGWVVIKVTAQRVAVAMVDRGQSLHDSECIARGRFCFLLEKE